MTIVLSALKTVHYFLMKCDHPMIFQTPEFASRRVFNNVMNKPVLCSFQCVVLFSESECASINSHTCFIKALKQIKLKEVCMYIRSAFGNFGQNIFLQVDQLLAGHDDSHGNVNISDFVRAIMHA